ncbi:hypothetical protein INR49_023770 [Caranx melampygus]|nr:hypothetical protein INR49_023770 [Caranx melampygus]
MLSAAEREREEEEAEERRSSVAASALQRGRRGTFCTMCVLRRASKRESLVFLCSTGQKESAGMGPPPSLGGIQHVVAQRPHVERVGWVVTSLSRPPARSAQVPPLAYAAQSRHSGTQALAPQITVSIYEGGEQRCSAAAQKTK